ncbi:MAG TPA: YdeI/OmpD-associated family protein [Candidatus Acidoferrum sp.]|nr:YdeI/OmpD-associated family protein [Candidatus Acidoferrum sp.]
MKTKSKVVAKSFKATLERMQGNLGWVIIRIPFDVEKVWGARGRLRVKGEINGFLFRTTLFPSHYPSIRALLPTSRDSHFLLVTKRMQAGALAGAGSTAQFRLEPDLEEPKAILPAELKRALSQDRSVKRWFDNLSFSIRKWICDQVAQPKGAAARVRRAERIAEQLFATMEAELELPPILKAAFARDPRAFEGWQTMTPTQRRYTLLGIFHYRNPESRERRIAKMLEEAAARAGGRSGGQKRERARDRGSFEELE